MPLAYLRPWDRRPAAARLRIRRPTWRRTDGGWRFAPYGQSYAGLWLGSCGGMLLSLWDNAPEYIAKWNRGAEGERMTERALRALRNDG